MIRVSPAAIATQRALPIGAERTPEGVSFRVWAPGRRSVQVEFPHAPHLSPLALTPEADGYFAGLVKEATSGTQYVFRLDGDDRLWPDPASRFQPEGPRGPSQIVDPAAYHWRDQQWPGPKIEGQVLYEIHIGTFTPEGTWEAARSQLAELANLGITALEVMPIAEYPGHYGWSYDGANLFAPKHEYGPPDDVRAFVDEAHRVGLSVILDVVYNHLGHAGEELLRAFSPTYFSDADTEWGAAINFDGEHSLSVREFFLANVRHWIAEYHIDGLRIDATQAFFDRGKPHILLQLAREARLAAGARRVLMVAESEPQESRLFRSAAVGGYEFDAAWNDDFHHAAMVRLTGRNEAYYTDYRGSSEEFVAGVEWGYLYQGQRYSWQDKPRGVPAFDIEAPRFINYLQNHDQLANSASGLRVHELTSPGRYRAMTALLLLGPQTPLLFQGQEFAASNPFVYFNDCRDIADQVRRGRGEFLSQFSSLALPEMQARLVDPCRLESFTGCKLDFSQRATHAEAYALHRDLLTLRHGDLAFDRQPIQARAATLGPDALLIRYFGPEEFTRLLLVNFGLHLRLDAIPQPLVAPPQGMRWRILWSSEDPRYGGSGTPEVDTPAGWRIPGEAAVLLEPVPTETL